MAHLAISLLADPRRQPDGLALVLPGIEGESLWNRGIVRGLGQAGFPGAVETLDWTRGRLHWLNNLQSVTRHTEQSTRIARRIIDYRTDYPTAPLWVLGHSGGGGMTILSLLKLKELAPDIRVTGAILLNPAMSRSFELVAALRQTDRGIWNFSAIGDMFFLGLGTTLFGTIDRYHSWSAGALGFLPSATHPELGPRPTQQVPSGNDLQEQYTTTPPLTEVPWRPRMLLSCHPGGHMGVVNPRFVRKYVAPILLPEPE